MQSPAWNILHASASTQKTWRTVASALSSTDRKLDCKHPTGILMEKKIE